MSEESTLREAKPLEGSRNGPPGAVSEPKAGGWGWRPAVVVENRAVARGSMWMMLRAEDGHPVTYLPGNVFGMRMIVDGHLIRHPYTVARADHDRKTFEMLYRVIPTGRMTPHLARLEPGDRLEFRGKYHIPIEDEVDPSAERVVGIATGTGIGPIFGFAERVLRNGFSRPLSLFVGFRDPEDRCLESELSQMAADHDNFSWAFSMTRPESNWEGLVGRVGDSLPAILEDIGQTHFHLVGNHEMIEEYSAALSQIGVRDSRISTETYFNWGRHGHPETIRSIVKRLEVSSLESKVQT